MADCQPITPWSRPFPRSWRSGRRRRSRRSACSSLAGRPCPPEIGARLVEGTREVWNTYGPTEATVVACGARLTGEPPVRIGLPLAGWDLAVVDAAGQQVAAGETGELIIGGVGLARYLDEAKDSVAYAAMPTLGWDRAYRSGDVVRNDPPVWSSWAGPTTGQGRWPTDRARRDRQRPARAGRREWERPQRSAGVKAGNTLLVGYSRPRRLRLRSATDSLRQVLPQHSCHDWPSSTPSLPHLGQIDRDALPCLSRRWSRRRAPRGRHCGVGLRTVGEHPRRTTTEPDEDFFDFGGGSLSAAQLVSRLRDRFAEVTVGDVYEHSTLASLTTRLDDGDTERAAQPGRAPRPRKDPGRPDPRDGRPAQHLGLRCSPGSASAMRLPAPCSHLRCLPTRALVVAPRRLVPAQSARSAGWGCRCSAPASCCTGSSRASTPEAAESTSVCGSPSAADELGATNISVAPFHQIYARRWALASPGTWTSLGSPGDGMLELGAGVSIEPEVDLRWSLDRRGEVPPRAVRVRDGARSAPAARCCPVPTSDAGRRWPRGRPSSVSSLTTRPGRGLRRSRPGRRVVPGTTSDRATGPSGSWPTPHRPSWSPSSPSLRWSSARPSRSPP